MLLRIGPQSPINSPPKNHYLRLGDFHPKSMQICALICINVNEYGKGDWPARSEECVQNCNLTKLEREALDAGYFASWQ